MKAALKYPVFYLAPAEHMAYVFWREENVTTRRLLAEADGWAGQEVVDASGRCYTIRRCWETGPVGLYGRIGLAERRIVRYDTDFEEEVRLKKRLWLVLRVVARVRRPGWRHVSALPGE